MTLQIGKNIRYYRKQRGFTQEQLADSVDISVKFLSTLENNHVDNIGIINLNKIADSLGIKLATLVEGPKTPTVDEAEPNTQMLINRLHKMPVKNREELSKSLLYLLDSVNKLR